MDDTENRPDEDTSVESGSTSRIQEILDGDLTVDSEDDATSTKASGASPSEIPVDTTDDASDDDTRVDGATKDAKGNDANGAKRKKKRSSRPSMFEGVSGTVASSVKKASDSIKGETGSEGGKGDGFLARVSEPFVNTFTTLGYEDSPLPDSDDIVYFADEDGDLILDDDDSPIVKYVPPEILGKWHAEYFYPAWRKARLARHTLFATIMLLMAIFFSLTPLTPLGSGLAAIALSFVLFLNFLLRFFGIALFWRPIPRIPYLSDMGVLQHYIADYDDYEEYLEEESIQTVEPVNDVVDGHPSPATILTRWMNSADVQWYKSDLIENSGGRLDSFKVRLLLEDNSEIWTDNETVDIMAQMTDSEPSQWREAYVDWADAVQRSLDDEDDDDEDEDGDDE